MIRITVQDIIKAAKSVKTPAGSLGVSASDIVRETGLPIGRVRQGLRSGIDSGEIVYAGVEHRMAIDGTMRHVPVYKPVVVEGKKKVRAS